MRHNRANWPTDLVGRRYLPLLAAACLGAVAIAAIGAAGIAVDSTLTAQDRGATQYSAPAPAAYQTTPGYGGQYANAAGYYAQQPPAGQQAYPNQGNLPAAPFRGAGQAPAPTSPYPTTGPQNAATPWSGHAGAPAGPPPARMAALPSGPGGANGNGARPAAPGATANSTTANPAATPNTTTAQNTQQGPATPQGAAGKAINVDGLDGNQVLSMAVERLHSYSGIGARVRHRVELFQQQLMGAGHYWQGPSGSLQSRLELQLQTDKKVCSWLQVCDGKTLWTYQQFVESRQLTQVDVQKVLAATDGQTASPSAPMSLGIGGLPEMLRRLNQSFTFAAPEPGTLGQWPVMRLVGTWKPQMLKLLLPEQAQAIEGGKEADLDDLAAHVPHRVTLYLGQRDLFPYRIEYEHPDLPSGQPMLAMEFFEVRFDLPVDPERFTYRPSYRKVEDRTAQYIQQLR